MSGLPAPVRGRARGRRVQVTPEAAKEVMSDAASVETAKEVMSDVASVASETPSTVVSNPRSEAAESGVTQATASSTSTVLATSVEGTASIASKSVLTVKTGGSGSATSDQSGKGLRVTLRDGFIKLGTGGEPMRVLTNYLHINKTPNFQLHQYRVDFNPEEDSTLLKKMLVRSQQELLPNYIFDGHMLYTTSPIPMDRRELTTQGKNEQFKILIKSVGYVLPDSPMYLQFYNMVMRKAMVNLGMEELGRHFYDRHARIAFEDERLELWPGMVTAIRTHEAGTLLCLEVTHKVLRMTTVLEIIENLKAQYKSNKEGFERAVKQEVVGTIVITHYNRRTYKIDEVDFKIKPTDSFRQQDGTMETYQQYLHRKHNVTFDDDELEQPALVSIPKKRDLNKGITGNIVLFPKFCHPTGLTDTMRKNFNLMKKLSDHLHMGPNQRKKKLSEFVKKIKETTEVKKEFEAWNIDFVPEFLTAEARKYPMEKVFMGPVGSEPRLGDDKADWTRQLKGRGMLTAVDLSNWVLFVPIREKEYADQLIQKLIMAARDLNVNVTSPANIVTYQDQRRVAQTVQQELKKREYSFAFVVLANNNVTTYAEVKKVCILDYGIGCQCFLAKNMNKNDAKMKAKLGSICTKVVIQITAKLGGVPWGVKIPVQKLMILGFDVYHCTERRGQSAGALVSTRDQALNQYFSTVSFHKDKSELAKNLTGDTLKSLNAFRMDNKGALPERIVLFRDGVGEGQINYVIDYEVPQLKAAIEKLYGEMEQPKAKLSVIIVTKKINSRVMLARSAGNYDNVPPGTVVDNTITLPERYDFFLVSQSVNQGTVSPTNYNVVWDESDWAPERMQKLSYKLCHLYYNWCGTVAVPAPCQYAHKLAYLTGVAINEEAPQPLATNLWYL